MALNGTEVLQVLAIASNGSPAASTEQVTTQQIANLAVAGGSQSVNTAVNTVGGTTLSAAAIVGKNITRGGTQTAVFTDTTDTAANIIAALGANAFVGQSFKLVVVNNTVFPETLSGGAGVTLSGGTTIPANGSIELLVIYSGAGAVTMFGEQISMFPTFGTFVNNGATPVTVTNSAITANSQVSITLKTPGGTVGASEPALKTITPQTGFTVAGLASDTSTYNYMIVG